MQRHLLQLLILATFADACLADGRVRFFRRTDQSFDSYTQAPTASQQQWMQDRFHRMQVFPPYFDARTAWYPNGLAYQDIYAIYVSSATAREHPEWILKDSSGKQLYIPWGCSGGTCPQFAADFSNAAFRRWWIDEAKRRLSKGYRGLWIDDVNMEFRVGDGNGVFVAPKDQNTGTTMTWENWRRYMAEFTEQIRAELPGYEVLHNSIWYAGPSGVRDADHYIQRQISSADVINIEHGVNDPGLTGGTGSWSLSALHAFIDRVHALGKPVVIDDFATTTAEKEYALANYFLINDHADAVGNMVETPDSWWVGYNVDLGIATTARQPWNGLIRRDYQGGLVLVNEPGAPVRSVTLPGRFRNVDGTTITAVTLGPKSGAVLTRVDSDTTLPVIQAVSASITGTTATVTWITDEDSNTQGEYGTTPNLGTTTALNATLVKAHSASMTGLTAGTTYYYRAMSADAAGNVARSAVLTFTTPALRDGTPPAVVSVSPMGTSVGATSSITSVVSEQLGRTTVTTSTAYVVDPSGATVAASVTYDATALTINIRPSAALSTLATYRVVIKGGSAGIKDLAGNALAADHTWNFSTAEATSRYLTDLPYSVTKNGYGPAEKDRSNGGIVAGDGQTITLNGAKYQKGLGVHAGSEVRHLMNGACRTFTAAIGLDDEVGANGTVLFEVWADGSRLYTSGRMTGSMATKTVNVSVAGRKELVLVMTDSGDGPSYDHGDWANAKLDCSTVSQTVYLSDLAPLSATNGWGPVEKDRSVGGNAAGDGRTLTLNGVTYLKGLGVHADSTIEYALVGRCTSFTADVGVDDEIGADWASVVFEVWADGVKLYGSPIMRYNSPTQNVSVLLTGRQKLLLKVTNGGDTPDSDHADWADAKITCAQ